MLIGVEMHAIDRRYGVGRAAVLAFAQAGATTLKISHQFPGGTIDEGDFRDRLTRKFAAEVEKRTKGALKFEIYPNASLMKAVPQFKAMMTGGLDMSLYPLAYAGGEFPEANLTLMPGLVAGYEQCLRWKDAPIGKELTRLTEALGEATGIATTVDAQGVGVAASSARV